MVTGAKVASQVTMESIQVKMQMASQVTESWERRFEDRMRMRMLLGADTKAEKVQATPELMVVDVLSL